MARSIVPAHVLDFRLEQRSFIEAEMPPDGFGMLEYLGARRIALGRHRADLLEKRHVDGCLNVAAHPRIAVPVPGAAEVACLLDQQERSDAGANQFSAGQDRKSTRLNSSH